MRGVVSCRFAIRTCLGLLLLATPAAAADFDLILRGGRVVDGTGNPAQFADVAIREGRIAALGRVTGTAARELDAHGCVIAPGFIDVHTHADSLAEQPRAENFVRMGVTTVIAGNCGSSAVDLAAWFRAIETPGVSVNAGVLVGQGSVRLQVMGGSFRRPPTPEELDRMRALVEEGMQAGALGLSTGLIYLPGVFSPTEELIELARVVGRHDGVYATHMRSEGTGILEALAEAFRIGREAGVRVQISHIKLSGNAAWGRTQEVLAAFEQARRTGLDVTRDQYVYTASSTGLSQLVPQEFREGGGLKAVLADPARKAELVAEMRRRLESSARPDYRYAVIADFPADRSLNGLNLAEAARQRRGSDTLEDQLETALELVAAGGGTGVFHGMSEEDLRGFAAHPHTMFASDSGVRVFGEGVPHPRGYGNAARVLARYVRELGLLTLEDAVRRMTTLPAATFRIADRGQLRPGAWADVVVFDPAQVQDHANFAAPHQYAAGFRAVL
ncbi:MAG TPA: D-aminoacylase, partial [Verrucomicrobiota bacterium]|nr:D-aminoacylase [Verrucomicrobiota bacterium]